MLTPKVQAVSWQEDLVVLLDQTKLPGQEIYLRTDKHLEIVDAIKSLAVRGAPAIGVAGGYAVVCAAREALQLPSEKKEDYFHSSLTRISNARPTAVNLRWAVERMYGAFQELGGAISQNIVDELLVEAKKIHQEDIAANQRMAEYGASLFTQPVGALTYCNTGDLATGGIGTAFGVLHQAYRDGKVTHVYTCETRPVMQGLRLTVWELYQNKIPFTAICDNMAALMMRDGKVGAVITGADRVAANGDSANKVGTYTLAVLAKYHNIPFYIAAPTSTFDFSLSSGDKIPIEERHDTEILHTLAPDNRHNFTVPVRNPSFDVTPNALITAIICEKGVLRAPYEQSIRDLANR